MRRGYRMGERLGDCKMEAIDFERIMTFLVCDFTHEKSCK